MSSDPDADAKMAFLRGEPRKLRKALSEGAAPNFQLDPQAGAEDNPDWSALLQAVEWGGVGLLKVLCDAGADVNRRNRADGNKTPLHYAAAAAADHEPAKVLKITKILLDAGAILSGKAC